MVDSLYIRPEEDSDIDVIDDVIQSAFENHPHSNQDEHLIVSELRNKDALSISLVAESEGQIVGHVAFSTVTVNKEDISWYGLGPVSVHPGYQSQGIGTALIEKGLEALQELNAQGCVLVGKPEFYNRFGFYQQDKLYYKGVPEEYFLVRPFENEMPSGEVKYHEAFLTNDDIK